MNSLEKLKKEIFFGEHSKEEWKQIKLRVDREMPNVSEVERQDFIESGAGPILEQVLEYIE